MSGAGIRNTIINRFIKNTFTLVFTIILAFPRRPEDRRVALVALWPQSRSEAETEGDPIVEFHKAETHYGLKG